MNYHKLHASLQRVIEKWVESVCEESEWVKSYYPPNGNEILATAAMTALKAIEDSGTFAESEARDETNYRN